MMMKISGRKIIEFVGLVSVVASLLFVGMQLRLDRELAAAEQYSTRAESRMETLRNSLSSDDYLSFMENRWTLNDKPAFWDSEFDIWVQESKFTTRDVIIAWITNEIDYIQFDNLYYQYNNGLLDEEFWQEARLSISSAISIPIRRVLFSEAYLQRPINRVIAELIAQDEYGP